MEDDNSEIFRSGWQAENLEKSGYCSLESKTSVKREFFALCGTLDFVLKALDWLTEAHSHSRILCTLFKMY